MVNLIRGSSTRQGRTTTRVPTSLGGPWPRWPLKLVAAKHPDNLIRGHEQPHRSTDGKEQDCIPKQPHYVSYQVDLVHGEAIGEVNEPIAAAHR